MPDNLYFRNNKLGIKGFKKVCIKAKNIPIQEENLLLILLKKQTKKKHSAIASKLGGPPSQDNGRGNTEICIS